MRGGQLPPEFARRILDTDRVWAYAISAPGRFERIEVPVPEAGDGRVVARLLAGGICGSDLPSFIGRRNTFVDFYGQPGYPLHEVVGEVTSGALPAGTRVVGWAEHHLGLAEFFVALVDALTPVAEFTDVEATVIQPLCTVLHQLDRVVAILDGVAQDEDVLPLSDGHRRLRVVLTRLLDRSVLRAARARRPHDGMVVLHVLRRAAAPGVVDHDRGARQRLDEQHAGARHIGPGSNGVRVEGRCGPRLLLQASGAAFQVRDARVHEAAPHGGHDRQVDDPESDGHYEEEREAQLRADALDEAPHGRKR